MEVLNLFAFNHNFALSALADCFLLFQGFFIFNFPPLRVNFGIPGLIEQREKLSWWLYCESSTKCLGDIQ